VKVRDVTSRENPLLARLRRRARDPAAYRRDGEVWLEGEHLCGALRERGLRARVAVVAVSAWERPGIVDCAQAAQEVVRVPDRVFADFSELPSPAGIGMSWALPPRSPVDANAPSIVLDGVQDAGNVGSVLRSAAAFGVRQVLALQGTAALWSPKVLRAGMGAHFALALHEGLGIEPLATLHAPLVATGSHAPAVLWDAELPLHCVWVFGHEGQGVRAEVLARCATSVRIPQPGGQESLNVAAAAAVCLYESLRRRARQPGSGS
jgi:TrmH family RNA methyltransferase